MIQEADGRRYTCALVDPDGNATEPNDENPTTMKILDHLIIALQTAEGSAVELVFADRESGKPWKFHVEGQ